MQFEEAINKIFDKNCVLFLGSGFSLGAHNVCGEDDDSSQIKKADELARLLYLHCGVKDSDGNLKKAASLFLQKFSPTKLIELLKQEYTISSISPAQEFIGSLDWYKVYTTNYDDVIEQSYKIHKRERYLTPVTLSDYPSDYKDKTRIALHLNGHINRLTEQTLNSEFRLTNRSYLADDFNKSKWIELFKDDLNVCDAIFFIGFSLDYDLDIARVIYNSNIKDKCFFIVGEKESDINIQILNDYGATHPMGLEGFVTQVKEQKTKYTPSPCKLFAPLCFSEPQLKKTSPVKRDVDFYDLLLKGTVNDHLLYHSILNKDNDRYPYFLFREQLNSAEKRIDNGAQTLLINAYLGNGKTLFLRALSVILAKKGYKVFFFERYRSSIEREILQIVSNYEHAVVIFDNFFTSRDHIEFFMRQRTNQVLVTSERTSTYETVFESFADIVGSSFERINIDTLDDNELSRLDDYLNGYSLWKDLSTKSKTRRVEYLKDQCNARFCSIVLSRLEQSDLGKRIEGVISGTKKREGFYKAVICILLFRLFNFQTEIEDISHVMENDILNNPAFKSDPNIREFINFSDNTVSFKSSILSQYILSNILDPTLVIDTLIEIATALDTTSRPNSPGKRQLGNLMSFRSIQQAMNLQDVRWKTEIFRYYETIKNLNSCKNNIHFWLQYAIARLFDYDYILSKAYFDKCYALARKENNYDTYKIDNHYCRFLLANEIENGNITTCMEAFNHAHMILITPHKGDELKHYPFRVAGLYYKFYVTFFSQMSKPEKNIFLKACEQMYNKTMDYTRLEGAQITQYVNQTKNQLEDILSKNKRS